MRTRDAHHPPAFEPCVSAGGRVSGTRTPTILACVAPPPVRTTARFLPVHRRCPWAERRRQRSPAGAAKRGSTCATWRACREAVPTCHACLTRLRAEASGLLACHKRRTTQGRSPTTLSPCAPRRKARPSQAVRRECRASLAFPLATAKRLGLDDLGGPLSSETIASLCGVATHHGVGQTQEAARLALRLPA